MNGNFGRFPEFQPSSPGSEFGASPISPSSSPAQAFAEADEPKNGDSTGDVLQHAAMPVFADLFPDLFDLFTTTTTFSAAVI